MQDGVISEVVEAAPETAPEGAKAAPAAEAERDGPAAVVVVGDKDDNDDDDKPRAPRNRK
jgi:hypothetical protein